MARSYRAPVHHIAHVKAASVAAWKSETNAALRVAERGEIARILAGAVDPDDAVFATRREVADAYGPGDGKVFAGDAEGEFGERIRRK